MSDSILWYATRGAGAVSLILLTAVVVLGVLSALRVKTAGWPRFLTTGLHRNLALMTLAFLGLHIVTAVVDPFTHLGWLTAVVPFSSYYRTFWLGLGTIAFELLLAIVVTSLARALIGNRAWRMVHWLTYVSWPVAVIHGIGTGTDTLSTWLLVLTVACVATVVAAIGFRVTARTRDTRSQPRAVFQTAIQRRDTK